MCTLNMQPTSYKMWTLSETRTRSLKMKVCPVEKIVVRLDERWCDCGKFHKIRLPCSHVIATYKHLYHDFSVNISPHYRLDVIMKVYDNLFDELRHEEY